MVKVPIWAYYCMNSYVTTRARSTRVLQYCHFDNFVLLTSSRLDGDYVLNIPVSVSMQSGDKETDWQL